MIHIRELHVLLVAVVLLLVMTPCIEMESAAVGVTTRRLDWDAAGHVDSTSGARLSTTSMRLVDANVTEADTSDVRKEPTNSRVRRVVHTGTPETDDKTSHLTKLVQSRLLQMLHLSEAPTSIEQSPVPEYVRALLQAIEAVPPTIRQVGEDQVMWAVKSLRVETGSATTTMASFHIARSARNLGNDSRVELVFELPLLLDSSFDRLLRTKTSIDICELAVVGNNTQCHHLRHIRHRRITGAGRQYHIFEVSRAIAVWWPLCTRSAKSTCTVELRLHVADVDVINTDNVIALLVVYQNMFPDSRATRKALKSVVVSSATSGSSRHHETPDEERRRRSVDVTLRPTSSYCTLHTWQVDFKALNWTWILAPTRFIASYCLGGCPTGEDDLHLANLTNHAFLRLIHRTLNFNAENGALPAPSCVPVRYNALSVLYQTDLNVLELRNVNEMVAVGCGCL